MKRKSQMEILGLAVVIVILLTGIVIFAKIGPYKKTETRNDFISSELASNMINTFLKTSARDCSQLTMSELLYDCARGTELICNDSANSDSCEYVKFTADDIFKITFGQWKVNYQFLAYVDINSPLVESGQKCQGEKTSKIFPLPVSTGNMFVKLDICR